MGMDEAFKEKLREELFGIIIYVKRKTDVIY
jgi:hypothetical protein